MAAKYVVIESRDPFESNMVAQSYELCSNLAKEGSSVTLFLVQNAVLGARKGQRSDALSKLSQGGVEVLADDFSLRERGIGQDRLAAGVKASPLDIVVDRLAAGDKAIWL
jgi:sulfur relay (sulfurtransferase) complex TusBCD TusD component (DsrE family)